MFSPDPVPARKLGARGSPFAQVGLVSSTASGLKIEKSVRPVWSSSWEVSRFPGGTVLICFCWHVRRFDTCRPKHGKQNGSLLRHTRRLNQLGGWDVRIFPLVQGLWQGINESVRTIGVLLMGVCLLQEIDGQATGLKIGFMPSI